MAKDCVQLYDPQPAPCFQVLGTCDLVVCPVQTYLTEKGIDLINPDFWGNMGIHWANHHICVQSIHNEQLPPETKATLIAGLSQLLNS